MPPRQKRLGSCGRPRFLEHGQDKLLARIRCSLGHATLLHGLEDTLDLVPSLRVSLVHVHNHVGELPLVEVLGKALLPRVVDRRKVHVVIADLKEPAEQLYELEEGVAREDPAFPWLPQPPLRRLHQTHQELQHGACLLVDQFQVLLLGRAPAVVRPVQVPALAIEELPQMLQEHVHHFRVVPGRGVDGFHCLNVEESGAVDGLTFPVDEMSSWEPTSQMRTILDVM